jgi:hypothetical protein
MSDFGGKADISYSLQIAHSVKSALDCFAKARGFQQGQKHMAKRRKVKSGAIESPQAKLQTG